jgi:ERCC4-type nuclease
MANTAYEQALEIVRALSPEEQQQLLRQIAAERRQQEQRANGATATRHHREREMRWLAEHEANMRGSGWHWMESGC